MDLIFWRHAEAEEVQNGGAPPGGDLERSLTSRGEKQAVRMGGWLDRQLPGGTRILVSPARRCEQTALALGRKYRIREELSPGSTPERLLELVQWPTGKMPVLVIGHQPTLGQTIAGLLGLPEKECQVKKGSVWWLRSREREGLIQTVIAAVQSPDML
jgi:phosphohistidine phosphatase